MKTIAIIQVRVGSTRLPKKVLLDLSGKTVIQRVIERVLAAQKVDQVVVATTINKEDLVLVKLCAEIGVSVFCGAEEDVLDRFYQAARLFKADQIVRITADCPLIDPKVIDAIVQRHLQAGNDYTSNTLIETFPDGEDVEVMTSAALKKAWQEAKLSSEREHVTPYIKKNNTLFKIENYFNNDDLSAKRWTIDNSEDYEFIGRIYAALGGKKKIFGMADILKHLQSNQGLEKLNHHIKRNEGYVKSLKEDREVVHG